MLTKKKLLIFINITNKPIYFRKKRIPPLILLLFFSYLCTDILFFYKDNYLL